MGRKKGKTLEINSDKQVVQEQEVAENLQVAAGAVSDEVNQESTSRASSDRSSSKSRKSSECSDCSDPEQHHKFHEVALGVVKDFFRDNFKTPLYFPGISCEIADHPHVDIAGVHNYRMKNADGSYLDGGAIVPDRVRSKDGKLRGLNLVIASLSFFDKEGKEVLEPIFIKSGDSVFKSFDEDDIAKNKRREYHQSLIDQYNKSLSDLLTKQPDLLIPSNESFKNPLLNEEGQYNGDIVYEVIKNKIIQILKEKKTIGVDGPNDDESRVILKSMVASRKHAEEALIEYMRSEEFSNQFNDLVLNKVINSGIDKIVVNVHSTKESCLPCQLSLRAIVETLKEVYFTAKGHEEDDPKDLEFSVSISSQTSYKHSRGGEITKFEDVVAVQYEYDERLSSCEAEQEQLSKATAFIDGIFKHTIGLAKSLASSAGAEQARQYKERLSVIEEENKSLKEETEALKGEAEALKGETEALKEENESIEEAFVNILASLLARGDSVEPFLASVSEKKKEGLLGLALQKNSELGNKESQDQSIDTSPSSSPAKFGSSNLQGISPAKRL